MSEGSTRSGWEVASGFSDGENQTADILNPVVDNSAASGGTRSRASETPVSEAPTVDVPASVNAETIMGGTRSRASEETTVEDVCNMVANPIRNQLKAIDTTIKTLYEKIEKKYGEEKRQLEENLAGLEKNCRFKENDVFKYRLEVERKDEEIKQLNEEVETLKRDKEVLEKAARESQKKEEAAKNALENEQKRVAAEKKQLEESLKAGFAAELNVKQEELDKSKSDMEALKKTHADEISKMENAHAEAIKAKDADWQAKLNEKEEELRKSRAVVEEEYSAKLGVVRAKIEKAMPKEVCDLFDYKVDAEDSEDTRRRLQCVYSFMCLLSGSLGKDVFLRRFRAFDAALLEIMGSDVKTLDGCRASVEEWLNKKLASDGGDCAIAIHWPSEGEDYNGDHHCCANDNASQIRRAKSASVFCKDRDGSGKCLSKAEVDAE